MKLISLAAVIILSMQGCSSIEEGEIDYVRTIANKSTLAKNNAQCRPELYEQSEYTRAGVTRSCYETLYRKYTKVPQIDIDENISIHLMQGFNGFSTEIRTPAEFFRRKGANAEMVVIANVCEQGVNGCSLQFGPESDKKGRVVYYSNGVKANQYLNFSYLPVYGPIKYKGGPLIIQISIIELDDLSDQQKNLLNVLADMGKKAYPPASAALQVLDTVGSSLLAGSNDDILFRYTMSLVPQSNSKNFQSPIVAEGNYAFIRKNTWKGALEQEVFDKLKFDNLSGRLVKKCSKEEDKETHYVDQKGEIIKKVDDNPCTLDINTGQSYKDYRDNTYLTFQIKSGFAENSLNNIQTFESLLSEINAISDEGALKAIEAFTELKEGITSAAKYNSLAKKLNDIEKTVGRTHDDLFEKYRLQIFQLLGDYKSQIAKLIVDNCHTTPTLSACKLLINEEQLTKIQLDIRTLLNRMNPSLSSITTLIPSGITVLPNPDTLQTELEKGYKTYFNKMVIEQYLGQFNVIKNLTSNIADLTVTDGNENYITVRKAVLKSELSRYLRRLGNDASLLQTGTCTSITDGSCYRYPDEAQLIELSTLFNTYGTSHSITAQQKIDITNKAKIASSLTISKIDILVTKVLANL